MNSLFENNTSTGHRDFNGYNLSATFVVHKYTNVIIDNNTFKNNTNVFNTIMLFNNTGNCEILNSKFVENKVNSYDLIGIDSYNLTLTLKGYQNYINVIYANNAIHFDNVTYWNGEIVNTNNFYPSKSINESGQNITIEVYDSNNQLVDTYSSLTDENGQITYNYSKLPTGEYTYKAYHPDNSYYTYIETVGSFNVNKYNTTVLDNKTQSTHKNRETITTATIKDSNNQNIHLLAGTKLVFPRPI